MRQMQGQKFISRVNFQNVKHHRQVLRQQIKPQLFQKLEVSANPSANYVNAYRSMYKDELQKTMEQHFTKKAKDEYQTVNDKIVYSLHPLGQSRMHDHNASDCEYKGNVSHYKTPTYEQLTHPSSMPQFQQNNKTLSSNQMNHMTNQSNYGSHLMQIPTQSNRFRDYFEERTNKFEDLTKKNFDGGQQFFKVQDAYQQKKQKETQNYAEILKKQLQQKEYSKISLREKQNMELMAFKEMQNFQTQLDKHKYMMEVEKKNMQNTNQMHEVEQERERKQRRSKQFQFNNVSLHNPITNPIEYHIDNPYILKKIQDRTLG